MIRGIVATAFAIALTTQVVQALPAHAASKAPHIITLIGSNATLGIADLNAKGPTPGDIRTLSLDLTNAKGQPAGRTEVVQTLTRQDGDVGTAMKLVDITLPRGTITGLGVAQFSDITDPKARPNDRTETIAITGGTGAFFGAQGQIEITVLPDFVSRWKITLTR